MFLDLTISNRYLLSKVLEKVFKYIYGGKDGKVKFEDWKEALTLLKTADEFNLSVLMDYCEDYLIQQYRQSEQN